MTSSNKQKFAKRGVGKARSQAGRSAGLVQPSICHLFTKSNIAAEFLPLSGLAPPQKTLRTFQRRGKATLAEIESSFGTRESIAEPGDVSSRPKLRRATSQSAA